MKVTTAEPALTVLNGICPYFTMFPLSFPFGILRRSAKRNEIVADPFCGRGTTNFAARLLGLESYGADVSPVAAAAARAKLSSARPQAILELASEVLRAGEPTDVPEGEFWTWAFHEKTLMDICRLRDAIRSGIMENDTGAALVGILLGALHGPQNKMASYLSNQAPRTYSPKPAYSVRFWKKRELTPKYVSVLEVIARRASRFYGTPLHPVGGRLVVADSRDMCSLRSLIGERKVDWVITSPPYYGLRTYVPDQWLRLWLLGGGSSVQYSSTQIRHTCPGIFANDLREVWQNMRSVSADSARMTIRFGAINDRPVDPSKLIRESLRASGWRITTIRAAGDASNGKRQAITFVDAAKPKFTELDVYCRAG